MAKIALIAHDGNTWARTLLQALRRAGSAHESNLIDVADFCAGAADRHSEQSCIYIPSLTDKEGMLPDLIEAKQVFQQSARIRPGKFILLSTALIYATGPARKCMVSGDYLVRTFGTTQACTDAKSLE